MSTAYTLIAKLGASVHRRTYNPRDMTDLKIYTKYGDEGETGLLYGGRISKSDLRTEAYGTTDEAVSALGLARALTSDPDVQRIVKRLQRELFTVGAELATDRAEYANLQRHFSVVTSDMTAALENDIDTLGAQVELPRSFIIPGATQASSALDLARSILRRAERRAVQMNLEGMIENPELIRYLNRASDLVFMLARYQDRALPFERLTGDDSC